MTGEKIAYAGKIAQNQKVGIKIAEKTDCEKSEKSETLGRITQKIKKTKRGIVSRAKSLKNNAAKIKKLKVKRRKSK